MTESSVDSEVIFVKPEIPFEISLDRNAGTGYIWQLDISKGLQLLTHKWIPSLNGLLGGKGQDKWVILSHTTNIEKIVARLVQPWRVNEVGYKANRTIVYLVISKS